MTAPIQQHFYIKTTTLLIAALKFNFVTVTAADQQEVNGEVIDEQTEERLGGREGGRQQLRAQVGQQHSTLAAQYDNPSPSPCSSNP
jgi:hypothetical protein